MLTVQVYYTLAEMGRNRFRPHENSTSRLHLAEKCRSRYLCCFLVSLHSKQTSSSTTACGTACLVARWRVISWKTHSRKVLRSPTSCYAHFLRLIARCTLADTLDTHIANLILTFRRRSWRYPTSPSKNQDYMGNVCITERFRQQ